MRPFIAYLCMPTIIRTLFIVNMGLLKPCVTRLVRTFKRYLDMLTAMRLPVIVYWVSIYQIGKTIQLVSWHSNNYEDTCYCLNLAKFKICDQIGKAIQ